MAQPLPFRYKAPVMILVMLSLLTGIFTGWFRLGVALPVERVFLHHGAIMTGSFLGTVILMERIVALKKPWLLVFPLVNASSLIFFALKLPTVASGCLIFGAVGLFFVFYLINRISSDLPHMLMWAGSGAWFVGNVLLLMYGQYAYAILWWMAFLLITIAAERLELNRFLPVSRMEKNLLVIVLLVFIVACAMPFHWAGRQLAGLALVLTGLWLLRYDMIWKSMKKAGIHHYSALLLMFGYLWLIVSGAMFFLEGTGWIAYDALLHTFFIGFVFSMILAHAPIVLPGVAGLSLRPFHPTLYIWGILLQVSLAMRITGSFITIWNLKQWGGVANGVVILCFFVNLILVVMISKKEAAGGS